VHLQRFLLDVAQSTLPAYELLLVSHLSRKA
jgi:hypothetical protein